MQKFIFSVIACHFFVSFQASATESYFAVRGPQLTNISFQELGPRKVSLLGSGFLGWKKTKDGYICKNDGSGGTSEGCRVKISAPLTLQINDFSYSFGDIEVTAASTKSFDQGQSITAGQIDAIKTDSNLSLFQQILLKQLYDVKNSTVFVQSGSCYSYQLEFFADAYKKTISRYDFQAIAASCP